MSSLFRPASDTPYPHRMEEVTSQHLQWEQSQQNCATAVHRVRHVFSDVAVLSTKGSAPTLKNVEGVTSPTSGRRCAVCLEEASGMYFGALVCLPCKSFFIRSTKDGLPRFTCLANGSCDVTYGNRLRCQYCRFQTCLSVGMCRKEKPEIVQPAEGQVLCRVCHDIANGVHFGVPTCEGCKKFFRRALKESNSYFCKFEKSCAMNPRNRNSCRYCRYNRCINVGMSRNAIRMGRPKKMGASDFRHIRETTTPYSIHSPGSEGRASSRSSSPILARRSTSFPSSPQSPFRHGSSSVIKVHGYPRKVNGQAMKDEEHGTFRGILSNSTTRAQQIQAAIPERSVIRSCGNPTQRQQHPSPLGCSNGSNNGNFRQSVLAFNSGGMTSSGLAYRRTEHQLPPLYLESNNRNNDFYSQHGNQIQSGTGNNSPNSPQYSLSNSPQSDLSNFSSSGSSSASSTSSNLSEQRKDPMMDIEDDLADILSTLTQYHPPGSGPVTRTTGTNISSIAAATAAFNTLNNPNNDIIVTSVPSCISSTINIKVEAPEYNMSCQYSSQQAMTSPAVPTDSHPLSPHQPSASTSEMTHSSNPTTPTSPTATSAQVHFASTASAWPATSTITTSSAVMNDTVNAPIGGEREWEDQNEWSVPPSNLFSQMYNSLMLTYNLGVLCDGSVAPEENLNSTNSGSSIRSHYLHSGHGHQGVAGSHSGQFPTSKTLMPLYT